MAFGLYAAAPARAQVNHSVTLTEDNKTTDSLAKCHLGYGGSDACQPAGPIETYVTTDSCTASKNSTGICRPVGITETYVTTDSFPTAGRGTLIGPSENLSHSDAVTVARNGQPTMSETLTINPTITALSAHFATISESHTTQDFVAIGSVPHSANVTEVVNESDSVARLVLHLGNMTENLSLNDSLLVTKCGALQEFLATSDAVGSVRNVHANMTETVTASDSILFGVSKVLSETNVTSDAVNAQKPGSFAANLTQVLTTTDSVATVHGAIASPTTTVTESDSVSAVHTAIGTMQEFLTTSDSAAQNSSQHRAVAENLSTNDQLSVSGPTHKSASMVENLTESDAVSTRSQFARTMSESVSESDSVSAPHGQLATMVETLAVTDSISTVHNVFRSVVITDTLTTNATISIVSPHAIRIVELQPTLDFVAATPNVAGRRRRFVVVDSQ